MPTPSPAEMAEPVLALVREASEAILAIYADESSWGVQTKDDDSPLTAADQAAHLILKAGLERLAPQIPVVSEEDEAMLAASARAAAPRFWLVDPLDGTKEFLKRNGEFTVNVALVQDGQPVFGAVWAPAQGRGWCGYGGKGGQSGKDGQGGEAWALDEGGGREPIATARVQPGRPLRVVTSRSHPSPQLEETLARLQAMHQAGTQTITCGSSLKICALAEGRADCYPRFGPTSEWDTAAADAVLRAAGGSMVALPSLQPLTYGKASGILNPHFAAWGDSGFDWASALPEPAGEPSPQPDPAPLP